MSRKKELAVGLIGDCSVGKTTLIQAKVSGSFFPNLAPTVGVDYVKVSAKGPNGEAVPMKVFDTPGDSGVDTAMKVQFRSLDVALLCFLPTEKGWTEQLKQRIQWVSDINNNGKILLVAMKMDLWMSDQSDLDLQRMAEDDGIVCDGFVATSALNMVGVDSTFDMAAVLGIGVNLPKRIESVTLEGNGNEKKNATCAGRC